MSRKAAIIFAYDSDGVSITITFYAGNNPDLTGVTFAPNRAEALVVKVHLEARGYVVSLPTLNVARKPLGEEAAIEQWRGTDGGLQSRRYRWLRGDGAWLTGRPSRHQS